MGIRCWNLSDDKCVVELKFRCDKEFGVLEVIKIWLKWYFLW